ncbi:T9SS type A sorting domain-containing protein [Winogradskyella sp. PC D3.3]
MRQSYATLILFLCFTIVINSQNFIGNWNVISLESNGTIINLPSTVTTPPNIEFQTSFSSAPLDQYWGRYIYANGICNSFTSYFENEQNNAISLIPYFETTDNTCATTEETDFENLYFSILQAPGNLTYSFTNDLHNLSFTNSQGDVINLGREDASTNVLSGEWFIHSIWDYDILLENTFDPGLSIIFSNEIINGQSSLYGSSTCNGFMGHYDNPIQSNTIIIRYTGWTLIDCGISDESYFEQSYKHFFEALDENIYFYEIIGSGSDAILILDNGRGANLTYGRQALAVDNFNTQNTKLITDVSNHKLQLILTAPLVNTSYTIYDMSGRQITSHRLDNSNSIEIDELPSGSYILNIKNTQNKTERFKFLKP